MAAPVRERTTPVTSLQIAEAARQAQLALRAQLVRDVAKAWPALNLQQLSRTWPGWLQVMTALIGRYHSQSADQAGLAYRAERQAALGDPGAPDLVRLAAPPTDQWVERALGFSGPGVFDKQVRDLKADPDVAAQKALTQTLGTASRIVLDGTRTTTVDTVARDPKAVGWYRVTDGQPCAFCALLASRGVVYKHDTAGFKSHNDCGCTGAPAFSDGPPLPQLTRDAQRVYLERGKGAALPAFRVAWAKHLADQANAAT